MLLNFEIEAKGSWGRGRKEASLASRI